MNDRNFDISEYQIREGGDCKFVQDRGDARYTESGDLMKLTE